MKTKVRTVVEGVEGLLCEPVHEFVLGGTPKHIATKVTREANAKFFSGDKKADTCLSAEEGGTAYDTVSE